jgi:hypothetical protein
MPISIDDAIALIVTTLRGAPALSPTYVPNARTQSYGCDLRVTDVLRTWWFSDNAGKHPMPDPSEMDYAPFHDAAWELARRGVLRPGPAFPGLGGLHANTEANGFSLTMKGREWITKFDQTRSIPSRPRSIFNTRPSLRRSLWLGICPTRHRSCRVL